MADVRIKPWHISLDGPVSEYSESLFAVGNGCLGMRGFSLQTPKRRPYDHAVFRAGFFEPIRPGVTDMVQLPDAVGLRVVGEEPARVSQELDPVSYTHLDVYKRQVKALWREDATAEQKGAFWRAWPGIVLDHPMTCLSATFHNTYGLSLIHI